MAERTFIRSASTRAGGSIKNGVAALAIACCASFHHVSPAEAGLPVSSLFWHLRISVSELQPGAVSKNRNDLAERVASLIGPKLKFAQAGRETRAEPHCLKDADPGFDRQLRLLLSVKRQQVRLNDESIHIALAGGVSSNGLFQERDDAPVVSLDRNEISDERVVAMLVEFVDKSVVEIVRKQKQ